MKKHVVYICLAMFVAFGCQKPVKTDEIASDNGKKWLVNPEMALHFEAMEAEITNFKSGEDIAMLQSRIKNNIAEVTATCTMKGQSHDELHKWLVPFIETVNAMQDQDPQATIKNLSEQFKNYHLYFESAPQGTK